MRMKLTDFIVGCWYEVVGSCYRFLVRIGILPLASDPFSDWEEFGMVAVEGNTIQTYANENCPDCPDVDDFKDIWVQTHPTM